MPQQTLSDLEQTLIDLKQSVKLSDLIANELDDFGLGIQKLESNDEAVRQEGIELLAFGISSRESTLDALNDIIFHKVQDATHTIEQFIHQEMEARHE